MVESWKCKLTKDQAQDLRISDLKKKKNEKQQALKELPTVIS